MSKPLGHEKLKVYHKGLNFVMLRRQLIEALPRRVSACEHLERGSESVVVNMAHASSTWSPKERINFLGQANGSALECAACLDVLVAKKLLAAGDVRATKSQLREIVNILITMKEITADRVREEHEAYDAGEEIVFSHESLKVYQIALALTGWMEGARAEFSCSADLITKLDKASTSIVLNIAEGNGRFTGQDQAKFLGIARKAAVHSSSLIDLATMGTSSAGTQRTENARGMLRRLVPMLSSLADTVTEDAGPESKNT